MQIQPDTQSRLTTIFQSFPDPLLVLDRDGIIVDYRLGDPRLFPQPPGQVRGRSIQEVLPVEVSSRFRSALQFLEPDQAVTMDYPFTFNGKQAWFEARLIMLPAGRAAVFIRDITSRKHNELRVGRQLERMAALRAIDLTITAGTDLDHTLNMLIQQVRTQLHVDAASILLIEPSTNALEFAAGDGFRTSVMQPNSTLKAGLLFAGRAAMEGRPAQGPGVQNHSRDFLRLRHFAGEGFVDYLVIPLIVRMRMLGVLEIFSRTPMVPEPDWLDFMNMLAGQAAIAIDSSIMLNNFARTSSALTMAYDATIDGWSKALELRDRETQGHTRRVTDMACRLGAMLGMTRDQLVQIRRGAALHDIGKMAIPDQILFKPGPLDDDEWEIMRQHPSIAVELLGPIEYLTGAMEIPQYHHERWDGTGYPNGLRQEQIPISARLFAVVDVYDALTSNRPYRSAWSPEQALNYIREESGRHFDPGVTGAFLRLIGNSSQD